MRNPLKMHNKSGKGCFTGIFKCIVVFQLISYNLQMFSRPSDIKCSFACSNFVLLWIIRIAEIYSELSRQSTMERFSKIFKGFQLLTTFIKKSILDIRLGFECASNSELFFEYFASLNLSSSCYCINKENS